MVSICAAVEDLVDKAAAERLISEVGAEPGPVYVRDGKQPLLARSEAYNNAARFRPWLMLVDLDAEAGCAAEARRRWLPYPAPYMCFRVVVQEIESWFLADRDRLAQFLRVRVGLIAPDAEAILDAKAELVRIAARSRSRTIRDQLVPRQSSGRRTGHAYAARLIGFAKHRWSPVEASATSASLRRALACVQRLAHT